MNKKSVFVLLLVVVSLGFVSGCTSVKNSFDSQTATELEEKNAVISITGTVSQNGDLFFITDSAGTIHDVETYSVDFSEYVGKSITATGQYSGNTLFVTEISL